MTGPRPELAWFAKADDDLELARRALGPDRPLPSLAAYHAQQCAEKYLKGYPVAHDVPFRFVHSPVIPASSAGIQRPDPSRRNLPPRPRTHPGRTSPSSPTSLSSLLLEPDLPKAQEAIHQAQQIANFVLQT